MNFGDLHFKWDAETQLRAIIAIHSTKLGPALGGCRCLAYVSEVDAINDALNLSQAMSYKAAITGLKQGGGKAVLMKPPTIADRKKYFQSFGDFVESLGGRYITAVDSGTNPEDMDYIASRTQYVASTSRSHGGSGDPSPFTALGVRYGIEAAVRHRLQRETLTGLHAVIQGVGHVGYYLAKELHKLGVNLTVADTDGTAVKRCIDEFGTSAVSPDEIFSVPCDIFIPCALGGVINPKTVKKLNCKIIGGAANNQLSDSTLDEILAARHILYAPDYVINAGGLIQVSLDDPVEIEARINDIPNILDEIFTRAKAEMRPTGAIADIIAKERFYASAPTLSRPHNEG
ncbi:MAG: amino acid dehydrogenase [Chromatiales bacterium]|nr:amino acid dehydrogenase [Chromatiales bacterium]